MLKSFNMKTNQTVIYIRDDIRNKSLLNFNNWPILFRFKTHESQTAMFPLCMNSQSEIVILTSEQLYPIYVCYIVSL